MTNDKHWSELDNQGDYVSGEIGKDGSENLVGKNLTQERNDQSRHQRQQNQQRVEVNIPEPRVRGAATVNDIYTVLAGNPLDDAPGLIAKVNMMDRRLAAVELGQSDMRREQADMKQIQANMQTDLVNITKLIKDRNELRNEQSGKIQVTPMQLFIFIAIIIVIMAYVVPWLWGLGAGGAVDGRVGLAIRLLFFS